MAPIVHGLEAEYYDRLKFSYLDIDDRRNEEFMRSLGAITRAEFFLLDANGKTLYRWFGYTDASSFREQFDQALNP
jgi:thioredoxin-related protein